MQSEQLYRIKLSNFSADVYAVLWSAAGGFGDPLERDPAKVAADVDNGDVSVEAAKAIYGVVLGDAQATERERNRDLRLHNSKPRSTKVDAPIRFLATENLAVRGERYACAKCAKDLGSIKDNYKRVVHIVIGRIVHAHVDPSVWKDGRADAKLLDPVCRLSGNAYASLGELFSEMAN